MSEDNQEEGELIEYSYNIKDGNYIKRIYYEFETDKAVKFGRNLDEKVLWIPKSAIKRGWDNKNKTLPQNIKVRFAAKLYWRDRNEKTE